MRKRAFALIVATALVIGLVPIGAAPAMAYTVDEAFPVSLAIHGQVQPDIDYPWIVWKDGRNCENDEQGDIYAYNFATGEETQVTTMSDPESNPSVSGDWVVYSHRDYSDTDYCSVYAQNLMTGELKLVADGITDEADYGNPAIDGTTIVYKNSGGDYEICLYDMATGITTLLTDDTDEVSAYAPEIGGGWVVCYDYYYDGSHWLSRSSPTSSRPARRPTIMPGYYTSGADYREYYDPSVDGGYVVCIANGRWTGDSDTDYGIFLYDLAEMETPGYEAEQISGEEGYGRQRQARDRRRDRDVARRPDERRLQLVLRRLHVRHRNRHRVLPPSGHGPRNHQRDVRRSDGRG